MKILITGHKGFIGSHLVRALRKKRYSVTGYDLKEGYDILDDWRLNDIFKECKPDIVFHLAALKSVPASFTDPSKYMQVNGIGTLRVLEASLRNNVKRLIYASSSSVYGGVDHPLIQNSESDAPNPRSPYAISKLIGEYLCKLYSEPNVLETIVLRYFNVFGPGQQADSAYASVIPLFIKALSDGKPCYIYGDGEQTRSFSYIDDVVRANLLAIQAKIKPAHNVLNIAGRNPVSINTLLKTVAQIMNKKPKVEFMPARDGDIRCSHPNQVSALTLLGYEPKVSLEDGLKRMIKWMK